ALCRGLLRGAATRDRRGVELRGAGGQDLEHLTLLQPCGVADHLEQAFLPGLLELGLRLVLGQEAPQTLPARADHAELARLVLDGEGRKGLLCLGLIREA